jgi:hypothetical protein
VWNLEFLILNDDDKRDPKELFKELAEKCKEEKIKEQKEQKNAPSES